jgi:hypothetical protein
MQITETERNLMIQKREEIRILYQEIFDLTEKSVLAHQDIVDIKKKFI